MFTFTSEFEIFFSSEIFYVYLYLCAWTYMHKHIYLCISGSRDDILLYLYLNDSETNLSYLRTVHFSQLVINLKFFIHLSTHSITSLVKTNKKKPIWKSIWKLFKLNILSTNLCKSWTKILSLEHRKNISNCLGTLLILQQFVGWWMEEESKE